MADLPPPASLPPVSRPRPGPLFLRALFLACLLLLPAPLPAASPARTADNRLTVSGASSVLNRQLANSLDAFFAALETRIAAHVPFPDSFPLLVVLSPPAAPATRPECLRMQAWDAGLLHQRLLAPAPDYLDAEDLEASLAALLLARCAADRTPPARRAGRGPEAPGWISAGLAQLLRPEALARDRRQIAADLAAASPLPLSDVLRLHKMPSGPWREKAYAAAAVDFLFPASSPASWTALFRALAAGDPVDLPHFQTLPPLLDAADPETLWHLHLRSWASLPGNDPDDPGDARDFAVEAALLRALTFHPRDWASDVPPDFPETLYAPDLIEYRTLPVARDLASALATHMQSFLLNASTAFRPVIAAYADYFMAFLSPPPPARSSRRNREAALAAADATFRLNLLRQWQRAEALHQQNLLTRQARRDWIDAVEARLFPPPAPLPPSRPDTPIHRYLDSLEF